MRERRKSNWILHWLFMALATLWLVILFGRARWYFSRKAWNDLALPHPESLTSKEKRRLEHYFYGCTYLHAVFCALRGRGRTRAEKHRLTNLAALAYFFDDLVDSFRHRDDSGVLWQDNPEEYGLKADDERRLALHFLHNIYDDLPQGHIESFKEIMHRVFNVETSGRQQAENVRLTIEDLHRLTAEKGGNSVLLFRNAMNRLPDARESRALYEFGVLIQYCDDIFDLWFDHHAGVATLATQLSETKQLPVLSQVFERQVEAVKKSFRASAYSTVYVETSLRVVHYIVCMTRLCLRHYEQLAQKYGQLPLHDRRQMVVDMERWPNRFRAAWLLAFTR